MGITRKRDNIHWTSQNLLSYNKTFNFAVSGRGPGKTTDIVRYMMNQHKRGYMNVLLKRNVLQISDTTISDFQDAYNILQEDDKKVSLTYNKTQAGKGIVDIFIDGDPSPFFRMIALNQPTTRLKGMAFSNYLTTIVFDEYKIANDEKYLKEEYNKFKELYSTLCRFGIDQEDGTIKPPRVIFLGNNYSLTDPYMANMGINPSLIRPGKILTGDNWAFEDIKITDELREFLLAQNPLFQFGDDAYNKYALDGISVSDQRIIIQDKHPDKFKLAFVFHIEQRYMGVFMNTDYSYDLDKMWYHCEILNDYHSIRRDSICFDFAHLVDGSVLISASDRTKLQLLCHAFRNRKISYKSIYEGYLMEQIYELC